ncbi:MAG: sigma-70 family RNA polymerase sigma factor [Bacteroidales bacterium]|nr:sigma-70 family RNA polymerase sigma factor [Bacteroidales bacterium]
MMNVREFEILARGLRPRLVRSIQPLLGEEDAEDVAQDTMLKLWDLRDTLDIYRSVDALAMVIARRLAINCLRDRHPERFETLDGNFAQAVERSPEDDVILRQTVDYVDRIIGSLPDSQATLIRLRHIEGYDNATIAAMLGSTEAAVRTALSRARRRVAEIFTAVNK